MWSEPTPYKQHTVVIQQWRRVVTGIALLVCISNVGCTQPYQRRPYSRGYGYQDTTLRETNRNLQELERLRRTWERLKR